MTQSDDVVKLFARFDGEKAKQYREVRQADQHNATKERWPVFKLVQAGFDKPMPFPSEVEQPLAVVEPLSSATCVRQAAPSPDEDSHSLQALFSKLKNINEPALVAEAPVPMEAGQPLASILSVFNRLRHL